MEIKTTKFKEWDYWYDEQCEGKKREVKLALKEYKRRNDEENTSRCYSCKEEYVTYKKKRKFVGKEIRTDELINQKGSRKIWVTITNILRKHLNTETLNSDSCLKHFSMLFTKVDKGVLLNEGQILGPAYIVELDVDFTVQEVNKFILSMKNNRATGCDGIPAEAWKMLVTNTEETEI